MAKIQDVGIRGGGADIPPIDKRVPRLFAIKDSHNNDMVEDNRFSSKEAAKRERNKMNDKQPKKNADGKELSVRYQLARAEDHRHGPSRNSLWREAVTISKKKRRAE